MKKKLNKIVYKISSYVPNEDLNYFDLSLVMTLLMFLFITDDIPYASLFMPLFIFPAVIFQKIRQNPFIWILLLIYLGYFYVFKGTERYVPNHKYLYAFYTLLIVLILYAKKQTSDWYSIFSASVQYMIGFIFLFATIGKFLAPEFLDGSFFEFTALTDDRLFGFTESLAQVENTNLWNGYYEFMNLIKSDNSAEVVQLPSADRLHFLAMFLSYWTIFIEGSIALTFLVNGASFLGKLRNWMLLIFIITTYPIATVPGFAILLVITAFISVRNSYTNKFWSMIFLIIFFLVPIIKLPFLKLIEILL